jgi:hypothetical protein
MLLLTNLKIYRVKPGTGHLTENNMPRKTKIIFIVVFVLVGAVVLGYYFYKNKAGTATPSDATNSGYQPFLGGSTSGQNTNGSTGTSNQNSTTVLVTPGEVENTPPEVVKFHQITDFAVAGATFFEDIRVLPGSEGTATTGGQSSQQVVKVVVPSTPPAGAKKTAKTTPKFETVPALRYVERITGHIDEMYLDTKTVGTTSNSTIPSIYEAFFDGSASSVIYRYLSNDGQSITSFLATLGSDVGEFLPSDVVDVSISPDRNKFLYSTRTSSGMIGTTRSFKDTKRSQVFSSPLTEWLSQWVTDQKIYLTTKASSSVNGDLFSLNIGTGVLTKVFGGVKGLTTLANKDGLLVLYSSSSSGNSVLGIFDVKNHTTTDLNIGGLPEKCIWGIANIYCAIPTNMTENSYPDSWYQGLTSFDDYFVKINPSTGEVATIASSLDQIPVDGMHLFLDNLESELFFTNKKDATLWMLDLN